MEPGAAIYKYSPKKVIPSIFFLRKFIQPSDFILLITYSRNSFSLYFSFYTIFSETAILEKPLSIAHYCVQPRVWLIIPYERISWNVFPILPVCLHAKNQCDSVIRWGGICDQRILQSIRLKVFPVTTQEQEFSLIWDLCSKIDNNNSFYLRTFSVKINHKIFKIMKKPCFWVTFDHFLLFLPKGSFC